MRQLKSDAIDLATDVADAHRRLYERIVIADKDGYGVTDEYHRAIERIIVDFFAMRPIGTGDQAAFFIARFQDECSAVDAWWPRKQ